MKIPKAIQMQRDFEMKEMIGGYYHFRATVAVANAIIDSKHGDC